MFVPEDGNAEGAAMSDVKPEEYHLSFRTGGRLLSGWFTILDGDMVRVRSEFGSDTTQLGGLRRLLRA
jgi:hypothetical protein